MTSREEIKRRIRIALTQPAGQTGAASDAGTCNGCPAKALCTLKPLCTIKSHVKTVVEVKG